MGDDKRRLFRVLLEVELIALVLAGSANDAERIAKSGFRDMDGKDDPSSHAIEFSDEGKVTLPDGWDSHCLVYHDKGGDVDVDVASAMAIHRSNRPVKNQIDMFIKEDK